MVVVQIIVELEWNIAVVSLNFLKCLHCCVKLKP
jgi:hypothetical protein